MGEVVSANIMQSDNMSERYRIEDSNDLDGFTNWCLDRLSNPKSVSWIDIDQKETAEEMIPILIEKFEQLQIKHNAAGTLPSPSESGELWNDFIQLQTKGKRTVGIAGELMMWL